MAAGSSASADAKSNFSVSVLRLGHRLVRDERISTHIGLVARAFGAKELYLTGADDHTVDSIKRLSRRWGGRFQVKYLENWKELIRNWDGPIVHLTMYGERLELALETIRRQATSQSSDQISDSCLNLLIVIGAEKVPREIYSLATFNVSVGNQPHSEVAALAVFLDRLFMGGELYDTFGKAKLRIEPNPRGKKVLNLSK